MSDQEDEYIFIDEAAQILGVSERQVNNYASENPPRIRTRGSRPMKYLKADVLKVAADRRARERAARAPKTQIMKPSEYRTMIEKLEEQLGAARQQIGYLQGMLEQRMLPDEERTLRQQLLSLQEKQHEIELEKKDLQLEVQRLQFELERERLQRQLDDARRQQGTYSEEEK